MVHGPREDTTAHVPRGSSRLAAAVGATRQLEAPAWAALLLLSLTTLFVVVYYVNNPVIETNPDTDSYLRAAERIMSSGQLVDATRTPGYPLLVALIFSIAGEGNLLALSVAQAVLFVVATLEVFVVSYLIARRTWVAFLVGAIAGSNTYLLSFSKPVVVEGFSLWVVVSLALAVVLCVQRLRPRYLWLVAASTLLAFMTRPEWVYVPIPLFAFLLIVAARRSHLRRLLPHALAAVVVLYGLLGLYVAVNATQNAYPGITYVQRVNLLGKVMQYGMQDEAPPEYAEVTRALNAYLAKIPPGPSPETDPSPYDFAADYPPIARDYWKLAGDYAREIVLHHPFEFLRKTVPVFLHSSRDLRPHAKIDPDGPLGSELLFVERISGAVHNHFYKWFPLFGLVWLLAWAGAALLTRRWPAERLSRVEMMVAVCMLGIYDLAVVSLGGYTHYMRLHIPLNPLRIVVVFGSLFLAAGFVASAAKRKRPAPKPAS